MIVSVCVVAYNEEKVLGNLLNDIKAQDYEHSKIEVVLIDSMSTDHTKDIMRDFQQQTSDDFKKIQVLENLKKKAGFRLECCNSKFFWRCNDSCGCTCINST